MLRIQRLANVFRGRVPARIPAHIPARVPVRVPAHIPARSFMTTKPSIGRPVEKVFKTRGGFPREEYWVDAKGIRVGPSLEWGDNGVLCREGSYRDGERHGLWRWWYHHKRESLEGSYVDGRKDGEWTMWDEQGNLMYRNHYSDDRLHGLCTEWYPSGEKAKEGTYVKGMQDGIWTEWHGGKQWRVLEYKDDVVTKVISLIDDRGRETVLPDGEIEVWKAGKAPSGDNVYIKIRVPGDARRVSTLHQKSRVERGVVVSIVGRGGTEYNEANNFVYEDAYLRYVVGEPVKADGFNSDPYQSCGRGIHVHPHREQCDRWFA